MAKQQKVSFGGAVKSLFQRWADFRGVSTRSEFWFAYLFQVLTNLGIVVVGALLVSIFMALGLFSTATVMMYVGDILYYAWGLFLFLPYLAVTVRRFHDAGFSAWIYYGPILWVVLTAVFAIGLAVFSPVAATIIIWADILIMFVALAMGFVIWCLPSKTKDNKYRK